jgi:lysophospholipid acyltransferase (LPLAT)-like uncharacterized protein
VKKETIHALLQKLIFPAYWFVCLYARTIRVRTEGVLECQDFIARGGKAILASWHQRFYGGFYIPRMFPLLKPFIMISRSRDGDFVADVVEKIGWKPVRGSSSRGGKEALRRMIDAVNEHRIGGHIVDGPQGPPRVVKPGLIALAQKTGAGIITAYVVYDRPWIFNSWDRFMVPRPFSRMLLRFSLSPIHVPQEMDEDQFEECRKVIENKMIRDYEELDRTFERD